MSFTGRYICPLQEDTHVLYRKIHMSFTGRYISKLCRKRVGQWTQVMTSLRSPKQYFNNIQYISPVKSCERDPVVQTLVFWCAIEMTHSFLCIIDFSTESWSKVWHGREEIAAIKFSVCVWRYTCPLHEDTHALYMKIHMLFTGRYTCPLQKDTHVLYRKMYMPFAWRYTTFNTSLQ